MAERKNILLLVNSFAYPGGTQKFVCELGKLLAERHNVFECSFDAANETRVFQNANPVLSLESAPSRTVLGRAIGYCVRAYRLNRLKKKHLIDVTISNLWPADFINVLSLGRGTIVSNGLVNVEHNDQNRMMRRFRILVGWLYRRFSMTVAINPALAEELSRLFHLRPGCRTCINAFVDLRDTKDVRPAFVKSRKRLVWFGRLHHMKNLAPLFRILSLVKSRISAVQLIVIGEGPNRDELLAEAQQAGLSVFQGVDESDSDVCFLGFVPDPYPFLKSCDLFVLTSRAEGFGLVLVEAMSVGLPILASDCPTGGPYMILGGKQRHSGRRKVMEVTPFGCLLPIPALDDPESASLWVNSIARLLSDADTLAEMGEQCMVRARDFSLERVRTQWFELLDAL